MRVEAFEDVSDYYHYHCPNCKWEWDDLCILTELLIVNFFRHTAQKIVAGNKRRRTSAVAKVAIEKNTSVANST
jgi:hypothetical protein